MENQPGYGAATVRLDPRGKVHVFGGDAPGGQGHETTTAQVVASAFGISPNDVVVTIGHWHHPIWFWFYRRKSKILFCKCSG